MTLKKKFFENFNLYAVTDITNESTDVINRIDRAFQGGVGILQLRAKNVADASLLRLGTKIREIARVYGRGFVVNDRVDIALALNADAVHLGQDDLPLATAKEFIEVSKSRLIIGKSTHSLQQATEAAFEGADYIGVGPIYSTPTKPNYASVGLQLLEQVKAKINIPTVAIGGINETNLTNVLAAGADAIAVVRAIFAAVDPGEAARKMRCEYDRFKQNHKK